MFQKLDKLLQLFGGRCIIVENGEPRYVVLSLGEYLALRGGSLRAPTRAEAEPAAQHSGSERTASEDPWALAKINREIEMAEKVEEGPDKDAAVLPPMELSRAEETREQPGAKTEYKIEDIPF